MTIKGIAILPKSKNSNGFSWIPRHIIPNFKIYSLEKSRPFRKLFLILKKLPKNIPRSIAIIAVEIGLLICPKSSIPMILLKP